jgi:hypothetical protein
LDSGCLAGDSDSFYSGRVINPERSDGAYYLW